MEVSQQEKQNFSGVYTVSQGENLGGGGSTPLTQPPDTLQ